MTNDIKEKIVRINVFSLNEMTQVAFNYYYQLYFWFVFMKIIDFFKAGLNPRI